MDKYKLLIACLILFIGQVGVWFQVYGPLVIDSLKDNKWFIYGIAIPITACFVYGAKLIYEASNGEMWASRVLIYGLGMISFSLLTWFFNDEGLGLKTITCLVLSFMIVLIQIYWK